MKLSDLIPGVSTARLIAYAVLGLALCGLITFAVVTINGWRSDSAQLAARTLERDQARAERIAAVNAFNALDHEMTAQLSNIAARVRELSGRIEKFETDRKSADARIDKDIDAFIAKLRSLPNAPPADPVRDRAVRDGLRQLFGTAPADAKPGLNGGSAGRAKGAGLSRPAAQRADVRGGRAALDGGRGRDSGLPLPAAFIPAVGARRRPVGHGADRGGDGAMGAQGSEPAVPDAGLGDVMPLSRIERARRAARLAVRAAAGALTLFGNVALKTVDDDGR